MQTLWTRAAQVRASCHCPQCVSSSSAVARRAAATATRRAPRYWTSSTVWYSGIFAVAATLDFGVKQQRREQWNKAIADVKQEIAQSSYDAASREFLDRLEEETVASPEMRENLDSSIYRECLPEWPVSMGQERLTNKLPPQSIYADHRQKANHMRNRWHPKKLERVQLCIDALQLEFFLELHRHGWHKEAASAVPDWYAQVILQPVEQIASAFHEKQKDLSRVFYMKGKYSLGGEDEQAALDEIARWRRSREDIPLCNYQQDELGQFHSTAHKLNRNLRRLFALGRNGALPKPAVLAKVYHNLAVSSAPPNIDTFNTLIVGLSDLGTRRLVEGCIHSLQCSMIRHNEVSLASMLNYWTLTGNKDEFQYLVQLMRGDWGGLSLAHAGVDITESSQRRLLREGELDQDRRDSSDVRVIQRPSPTPMVFGALIKGVIKFSGFDAALRVCNGARGEGWGPCIGGLYPLLKDCSSRRDWDAGLATWKQIQTLRLTAAKQFEQRMLKTPTIDLPTFASMLQLCTRCNKRTAFEEVMKQAAEAHPESAADLVKMVRAERAEMQISDQEKTSAERDLKPSDLKPTSDISSWLKRWKCHEFSDQLKEMQWQEMIQLDGAGLLARGVVSNVSRRRLLQLFQKVQDISPVYGVEDITWMPMKQQRELRMRILKERQDAKELLKKAADNASDGESIEPVSHQHESAEPGEPAIQQAHQRDESDHPLLSQEAVDLEQHASYAVGMALVVPDQLNTAWQPHGH